MAHVAYEIESVASRPQSISIVLNNFNYGSDAAGARCPFHAHIRKSTPRGDSTGLSTGALFDTSSLRSRQRLSHLRCTD